MLDRIVKYIDKDKGLKVGLVLDKVLVASREYTSYDNNGYNAYTYIDTSNTRYMISDNKGNLTMVKPINVVFVFPEKVKSIVDAVENMHL